MSYRIDPGKPLGNETRRIVAAAAASAKAVLAVDTTSASAAWEARKAVKRARSALRLVRAADRAACGICNGELRAVQAALAMPREEEAHREAAISMRQWCAGQGNRTAADLFDRLRAALDRPACVRTASRAWTESPDRLGERLDQAVRALDGFADGLSPRRQCRVIETGLSAAMRKAAVTLDMAVETGTPDAWHEFRKHVKHHRMHMRLLKPAWPGMLRLRADVARLIQVDLGEDHDIWLLQALAENEPGLAEWPDGIAELTACVDARSRLLRRDARRGARYLFRDNPSVLAGMIGGLWRRAQKDA